MSLIISNKVTDKQRAILKECEYYGTFNLTIEEAAKIIDELFEEQRLQRQHSEDDLLGTDIY